MKENLIGRSLLTLLDFTQAEIRTILSMSHKLKKEQYKNKKHMRFKTKTLAMLFEKRSTRTRCSFETAFGEEGGCTSFLTYQDLHLGEKESIEDTARVLGRMFNGIVFRGYKQETVDILKDYSGLPVYNGLTDIYHPTQALADLMTIEEEFGELKGLKCVYIGDGRNNVARSLLVGCCKTGVHISIVTPQSLMPDNGFISECGELAHQTGAKVNMTASVDEGIKGAHIIYTDVWVSMGEEEKKNERIQLLTPYQVNQKLMDITGRDDTIFLHCLPAVKGQEVTEDVFEGPFSRVWNQAENRKHTIKSVLLLTLG